MPNEARDRDADAARLTIGEAAQRSGVPAKTIRFYEAEGLIPAAGRTPSGYRLYSATDVRRLRLLRRLRALGLELAAAREVADGAFAAECRDYVRDVARLLEEQCAGIDRQVAELLALRAELGNLAEQARAAAAYAPPGLRVEACGACVVVDGAEPVAATASAHQSGRPRPSTRSRDRLARGGTTR
jgi:DNA-binding transcriptional MerR regulator